MAVCSHCGELYPDGRLNCPHCGMDAEQGWTPDPEYGEFEGGSDTDEDAEYQAFLEREGLASPKKQPKNRPKKQPGRRGCGSVALIGVLVCAALIVLL